MPKNKIFLEALTPRRSPRHQKKCYTSNDQQLHTLRPASVSRDLFGTKFTDWDEDMKQKQQTMAPDNPVISPIPNACQEEPAVKTRGFWMWSGSVRIRIDVPDEFRDIMDDTETSNSIPSLTTPSLPKNPSIAELNAHIKI
ncbi:hypothetical protein GHT06_014805 [Daphnia sinensis]|uniref:Uncharacterized protein n=1 Tax=Daphnia sinensis TaxID=1820382 RepID=A0AAD5KSD8_9CRUS|nr:hypothetical protein GHT06_014805 [Daphnia sinensis]